MINTVVNPRFLRFRTIEKDLQFHQKLNLKLVHPKRELLDSYKVHLQSLKFASCAGLVLIRAGRRLKVFHYLQEIF